MSHEYFTDLNTAYNTFHVVPYGINTTTGQSLTFQNIHPERNIKTLLDSTSKSPFTPQREGLPIKNRGKRTKQPKSFYQNFILHRGKYYYPYVEDGTYYFPYYFGKNLYYYPFSATNSCFCQDDSLAYKVTVAPGISGQCIPAVQCQHCNMDYYYMCSNLFPIN